jgi:hypothetical protein
MTALNGPRAGQGPLVFLDLAMPRDVESVVVALRGKAAEVVDAELARLAADGISGRALDETARTVRRVVDKLLHAPTVRVKELVGLRPETKMPRRCRYFSTSTSTRWRRSPLPPQATERSLLAALAAGCSAPVAAYAADIGRMRMQAAVLSADAGNGAIEGALTGTATQITKTRRCRLTKPGVRLISTPIKTDMSWSGNAMTPNGQASATRLSPLLALRIVR